MDLGHYEVDYSNSYTLNETAGPVIEAGTVNKSGKIVFDLGIGFSLFLVFEENSMDVFIKGFFFVNFVIGFNKDRISV